jgi:hypothetical protein
MTTITTTAVHHTRSHSQDPDLELSPVLAPPTDPYALQTRLIPKDQLATLRHRSPRKVREFYEEQNANIERMLKSVDEHRLAADIEQEENSLKVTFTK